MKIFKNWTTGIFIPTKALTLLGYLCLLLLGAIAKDAWSQDWIYTVRLGDNLWDLTEKYLSDIRYWRRLQALNQVKYPRKMPPGMHLRIPIAWLKIQPAAVRVLQVHGEAEVKTAEAGQRTRLRPGMLLHSGAEIYTGNKGNVTLEFADGSHLLIQADSYLVLDTISVYDKTGMVDTRMRLQQGRVNNRTTPSRGPGTRYEIQTPAIISTVRGTDYRIGMNQNPPVGRAEVLTGKVAVQGGNKKRIVSAGFGTLAQTGKPPLPPIPLLDPPDLSKLPPVVGRVPIQLNFPSLQSAVAYRVQIAPDQSFTTLLFDAKSPRSQIRGADLPDGDYILRIRGIDINGLEGRDAYHRFSLNARPQSPVLLTPAYDAIIRESSPIFRWAEPTEAVDYRFQLANNEHFEAPILDIPRYPDAELIPKISLQPGVYYWRVATRDTSNEQGPFSDTQRFKLKPAPSSPALETFEIGDDTIVFRWQSGLPGQTYQFQLANDYRFQDLVLDKRTTEPQLAFPRPPSGPYYLRIRMIDSDGFPGPYGMAQRIQIPPASYWPYALFSLMVLILAL